MAACCPPGRGKLIGELGSRCIGASAALWAELALACDDELVLQLDDPAALILLLAVALPAELPPHPRLCASRAWAGAMRAGKNNNNAIWRSGASAATCRVNLREQRYLLAIDLRHPGARALLDLAGSLVEAGVQGGLCRNPTIPRHPGWAERNPGTTGAASAGIPPAACQRMWVASRHR